MSTLDYRGAAQVELLGTLKRRYGGEIDRIPTKPENAPVGGFHLDNDMFGSVDAEILYAMVRDLKPKHILEIGSGWSTLLALQALAKNAQDGHAGEIVAIDPVAPGFVYDQGARIRHQALQDVGQGVFDMLGPGDILFADTSHVFIDDHEIDHVLRAMGRLSDVYVHFHDIFLPGGYPEAWSSRGYDEQDHLIEFLFDHPEWEVILGAAYLHQAESEFLKATFTSYDPGRAIPPGSFWLYRPSMQPEEIAEIDPESQHAFVSSRDGRKCIICGMTEKAKRHQV